MNAFDLLISQINEELELRHTAICQGGAGSYDEYKRLCGEVRGLLVAKEITETLKKKMENSDDE
jgi:hypothetical protein